MKKTFLFFTLSLIILGLSAQVPQSFKYQAVARDNDNAPLKNKRLGLKVEIRQGTLSGHAVYSETFDITSNNIGIFSVDIGKGTPVKGSFTGIDWGNSAHFLNIAIDVKGGTHYKDMGTTQLLSVPYSLYTASIYVNYSNDTLYIGDQYVVISGGSTPSGNTITDYDGNVYGTVKIGNQTWLKQNLRSLHYADGTPIDSVWVYDDNESNAAVYGRLYSWDAAMNGASSSNGNPSGVQGACPDGWHMPSKAEFEELIDFVGGAFHGGCALKSSNSAYWETSGSPGTNSSGFSARGAGKTSRIGSGSYLHLKEGAVYWTATEGENHTNLANHMNLTYKYCSAQINYVIGGKDENGYSVRCVKDE